MQESHLGQVESAASLRGWPSRRDFYRRWLKEAFGHAFGIAEVLATILGLIVPLTLKFLPSSQGAALDLIWEIPLAVFGTVATVRFLLAPYWLYLDLERRLSLPQPVTLVAKPPGRVLDRLASQHLAALYQRCTKLYWDIHSPRRKTDPETRQPLAGDTCRAAREWTNDLCDFLQREFGEATVHVILEALNPNTRLREDAEPALRDFTERAVKEIRALMQRAA